MKNVYLIFLALFVSSCDQRTSIAKQYVMDNFSKEGFKVEVIDVEKTNGENYVNKYNGSNMYAMEFMALCRLQENGYLLIDKDSISRNFKIFKYNVWDSSNIIMKALYIGSLEVNAGDEIKCVSKVIMIEKDNGWEPVAIRADLH